MTSILPDHTDGIGDEGDETEEISESRLSHDLKSEDEMEEEGSCMRNGE